MRKSLPRIGALALLSQLLLGLLILGSDSPAQPVAHDDQPVAHGTQKDASDRQGGIEVVASDLGGTQLLVTAGEPRFQALSQEPGEEGGGGGQGRVRMELAGFLNGSPPGAPNLPARTVLVAIPSGSRVSLSVSYGDERDYPGFRLAPAPTPGPPPAPGEIQTWEAVEDATYYRATYPAERVSLSPVMQIGDLDVVAVTVWPAAYDPERQSVGVAGRIEVNVNTDGGEVGRAGAPGIAPARGDPLGCASVVNPEAARSFVRPRRSETRAPLRRDAVDFTDSANWVKISVDIRGLVRVDGAALAAAGVALATIDPATLRLFWGGGLDPEPDLSPRSPAAPAFMEECAIDVDWDGSGSMAPTDAVIFFGQGASGWLDDYAAGAYALEFHEHPKVDRGVYWLTWGGSFPGPPRRIETREATPTGAPAVDRGRARIHFERNRRYVSGLFEGGVLDVKWERWWDANLRDTGATVFFPVTPVKPEVSQPGSLRLRLWGSTDMGRGAIHDHYAKAWFNSEPIFAAAGQDTFIWDGPSFQSPGSEFLTSGRQDIESDELTVIEGENRVEIDVLRIFDPANPNRVDEVLVAWFDLGYVRRLDLTGEPGAELLPFGATGPVTVEVTGVASGAEVYDVTDPRSPVLLTGAERQGSALNFAADLAPDVQAKFLVGVSPRAPAAIEEDRSQPNLRDPTLSAWYVVIAHDSMIDEAVRLAETHRMESPPEGPLAGTTLAVRVSDVYDEFGWGLKSDVAIRNFVDYAAHAWADGPEYICLLGDASYDPKDIFGGGGRETDLVPAPQFWNWIGGSFGGSDYVSDDYYVRTFGTLLDTHPDVLTDLSIGRLPAGSVEEARVIIDEKIIPFLLAPEYGPWRQKVILLADDQFAGGDPPRAEGYTHSYNTEAVSDTLPEQLERVKIYMIDYPQDATGNKPTARADFIQAFIDGAAAVNYIGHGAPDILAHEAVFRIDNVAELTNGGRLPLFSTFSCTVNRFDEPSSEGIGEALVSRPGGGSVVSIGSTDLAFISSNQFLNLGTYSRFFVGGDLTRKQTVGIAFGATKNELAPTAFSSARKYVLLGDPALTIPTPDLTMRIDFPGTGPRGGAAAELVAGVPYNLTAAVDGPAPVGLWDALVQVRDSEIVEVWGTGFPPGGVTYALRANAFFRSGLEVSGDTLRTSLVVPVDAAQSQTPGRGNGRARVYASGSAWDAFWADPLFLNVADAQPSEPDSDGGPRIEATFDGRGLGVAPNAMLHIRIEDKSGINIVGNTASSSVFMRIDETRTVELNELFAYDPGSATQGSVDYRLPGLSEGAHLVRIFASDNYLNRSEEEIEFSVEVASEFQIRRAGLYPNPFDSRDGRGTVVSFELTEPADVTFRIYSVSGKLVRERFRELDGTVDGGIQQIHWDGRDEDGDLVANGVYLCSISAQGLLSGGTADAMLRSVVRH